MKDMRYNTMMTYFPKCNFNYLQHHLGLYLYILPACMNISHNVTMTDFFACKVFLSPATLVDYSFPWAMSYPYATSLLYMQHMLPMPLK